METTPFPYLVCLSYQIFFSFQKFLISYIPKAMSSYNVPLMTFM